MVSSTKPSIVAVVAALVLMTSTLAVAEDLTASHILFAYRAGAPVDNMIKLIHDAPSVAPVTSADLDNLRSAGVSEQVVQALVTRSAPVAAPGMARAAAGAAQAAAGAAQAAAGAAQAAGSIDAAAQTPPGSAQGANAPAPPPSSTLPPVRVVASGSPEATAPQATPAMTGKPLMFEPLIRMMSALKKDQVGSFGLKENRVEWYDSKDSKNNFSLFGTVLKTVWLECEPRPQGNFCYELGVNTLTGETYRYRDVDWEKGGNSHILELYQTLKTRFPHIVFQEKVKSS